MPNGLIEGRRGWTTSRLEYFQPDSRWTPAKAATRLRRLSPSGRIPWERITEDEIQSLLTLHYQSLGYDVRNLHKDDRSREHGTDLLCSKVSLNKTIAVAVKVNPGKDDLFQLQEFSKSPYAERHYVYTGRMTRTFLDQKTKTVGVDFVDEKGLELLLQASGIYYILRIHNSKFFEAFAELMWNLLQLTFHVEKNGKPSKDFPRSSASLLDRLWSLKDRAVTVSRGIEVLHDVFDYESLSIARIEPSTVLALVETGLDTLYSEGMVRFLGLLDEKMIDLVGQDYLHSGTASNWLAVPIHQFFLQPGKIDTYLKKSLKDSRGLPSDEWKGDDDFYSMLSGELRLVFHATADIEEIVDDMFMMTKPLPTESNAKS